MRNVVPCYFTLWLIFPVINSFNQFSTIHIFDGKLILLSENEFRIYSTKLEPINSFKLERFNHYLKFSIIALDSVLVCEGSLCNLVNLQDGRILTDRSNLKSSNPSVNLITDFLGSKHLCSAYSFQNISALPYSNAFSCFQLSKSSLTIPRSRNGLNSKKASIHIVPTSNNADLKLIRKLAFSSGNYFYFLSEEIKNGVRRVLVSRICNHDLSLMSSLIEFPLSCNFGQDCQIISGTLIENKTVYLILKNHLQLKVCSYSVRNLDLSAQKIQRRCYNQGNISRGLAHYKPDEICPGAQGEHITTDICIPPAGHPYPLGGQDPSLYDMCVEIPNNYRKIMFAEDLNLFVFKVNKTNSYKLTLWNRNLTKLFSMSLLEKCPISSDFLYVKEDKKFLINCNGKPTEMLISNCLLINEVDKCSTKSCHWSIENQRCLPNLQINQNSIIIPNVLYHVLMIRSNNTHTRITTINQRFGSPHEFICKANDQLSSFISMDQSAECTFDKYENVEDVQILVKSTNYFLLQIPMIYTNKFNFVVRFSLPLLSCYGKWYLHSYETNSRLISNKCFISVNNLVCLSNDESIYKGYALYCNSLIIFKFSNRKIIEMKGSDDKLFKEPEDYNTDGLISNNSIPEAIGHSIFPSGGIQSGGTYINIYGSNLRMIKSVQMGRTNCLIFKLSHTKLTCQTLKFKNTGKYNITITKQNGLSEIIDGFLVVPDPSIVHVTPVSSLESGNHEVQIKMVNSSGVFQAWVEFVWRNKDESFSKIIELKRKYYLKESPTETFYFLTPTINISEPTVRLNFSVHADGFSHDFPGGFTYIKTFYDSWFKVCGPDLLCINLMNFNNKALSLIRPLIQIHWKCRRCHLTKQGNGMIMCRLDRKHSICYDDDHILLHIENKLFKIKRQNISRADGQTMIAILIILLFTLSFIVVCIFAYDSAKAFLDKSHQFSSKEHEIICALKQCLSVLNFHTKICCHPSTQIINVLTRQLCSFDQIVYGFDQEKKMASLYVLTFLVWFLGDRNVWSHVEDLWCENKLSHDFLSCLIDWRSKFNKLNHGQNVYNLSKYLNKDVELSGNPSEEYCALTLDTNETTNEKLHTSDISSLYKHNRKSNFKIFNCWPLQRSKRFLRSKQLKKNPNDFRVPSVLVGQCIEYCRAILKLKHSKCKIQF